MKMIQSSDPDASIAILSPPADPICPAVNQGRFTAERSLEVAMKSETSVTTCLLGMANEKVLLLL